MSNDHIYRLLKLVVWLLGRIPVGVADFCADFLGLLWFKMDKRHRQVTLQNIAHAFGGQMNPLQIEMMAKQAFKNIARIPFEITWSWRLDLEELLSHVTVRGIEHVENAHAKGRGVIVVSCHMGNFEMLLQAIYETGLKGYGVYRRLDFEPLERFTKKVRQRVGVGLIPIIGASNRVDTILSQGGIVGTMLDQSVDWYKGVFVDFFGRPACTNKGLAMIALRTKAPVIPLYTVRKNRKYLIEFLPEIPRVETNDEIKDLEINTQNYSTAIESMVREYPDQYFWVHNRWKTKNSCPWPRTCENN